MGGGIPKKCDFAKPCWFWRWSLKLWIQISTGIIWWWERNSEAAFLPPLDERHRDRGGDLPQATGASLLHALLPHRKSCLSGPRIFGHEAVRGGGNNCCMSGHLTMFKTKYKFKESRFVLNVFNLCHKSLHICVWKWQLKQKENDCVCQCNKMLLKSLQNCIKLWINYKILIIIDYLFFIVLFGIKHFILKW